MNIWQSLAFSSVGVGEQFLSNWSHRIKSEGLDLTYRSARSTNVFVLAGKRWAIQTIEDELNKLIPKFIRKTEHGLLDTVRKQQEANYSVLIKNQETQMKKYGSIHPTGGHPIVARDKSNVLRSIVTIAYLSAVLLQASVLLVYSLCLSIYGIIN